MAGDRMLAVHDPKTTQGSIDFYDFDEYETLVDAAAKLIRSRY